MKLLTSRCAVDARKYITAVESAKRKTTEFIRDTVSASARKKPKQPLKVKNKRIDYKLTYI